MRIITTLESQISLHFFLRPAVFELQATDLETSTLDDPKLTFEPSKGQMCPIYVL